MEYNFEEAIGKLLHEQGKTKKSLYDALKLTRQGFDNKLKNRTVSVLELSAMATFFNIDESTLMAIMANRPVDKQSDVAIGDSYLRKHLNELEGEFAKLVDQLKIKDHQLEKKDVQIEGLQGTVTGLQRMLESVLGKSEGVTDEPLSTSLSEFNALFNSYRLSTGYGELVDAKPTNNAGGKVGGTPFSHAENKVKINDL